MPKKTRCRYCNKGFRRVITHARHCARNPENENVSMTTDSAGPGIYRAGCSENPTNLNDSSEELIGMEMEMDETIEVRKPDGRGSPIPIDAAIAQERSSPEQTTPQPGALPSLLADDELGGPEETTFVEAFDNTWSLSDDGDRSVDSRGVWAEGKEAEALLPNQDETHGTGGGHTQTRKQAYDTMSAEDQESATHNATVGPSCDDSSVHSDSDLPNRWNQHDCQRQACQNLRQQHKDEFIGSVLKYPVQANRYSSETGTDATTLSMLRLIDYCDNATHNSRSFLDGLLKIIGQEILDKGFQPQNAPLRKTVMARMEKKYGGRDLEPTITWVRMKGANDYYDVNDRTLLQTRKRDMVACISFNIEKYILDLLDDRAIFGNVNNLVVNGDDPFLPYLNTTGSADEIMDGSWYPDTLERLTEPPRQFCPNMEFLFPIVVYLDKTGTALNQRYPLEPVLFTTAIIRRALRNCPRAWRPVGFIPDLETKSKAEKDYLRTKVPGNASHNYHRCLQVILTEAFQRIQDKGMFVWLRLGDQVKKVKLRPQLCCIFNDGKSADAMCSRYGGYYNCVRISRSCETPYKSCNNVMGDCAYVEAPPGSDLFLKLETMGLTTQQIIERFDEVTSTEEAEELIRQYKKELNEAGFQGSMNAFISSLIEFGLDPRGVWGANPIDLMHAVQSGIIPYVVHLVLDPLPDGQKAELDTLVDKLLGSLRSSEKTSYPRYTFSKGYSKLTLLTSDEWPGMLFVLLLVLRTERGREILGKLFAPADKKQPADSSFGDHEAFRRSHCHTYKQSQMDEWEEQCSKFNHVREDAKEDEADDDSVEDVVPVADHMCSLNDFVLLAETLLSFHAWYKVGDHWLWRPEGYTYTSHATYEFGVRHMLAMIKYYIPRTTKRGRNGWKLQKFHDLLHLIEDMMRHGSPKNFDCGPNESGLRNWAKEPASTSQNRGYEIFIKQVASRLYESNLLAKSRRENDIIGIRDTRLKSLPDPVTEEEVLPGSSELNPVMGGSYCYIYTANQEIDTTICGEKGTKWSGSDKQRKGQVEIHPAVLTFIREKQNKEDFHGRVEPVDETKNLTTSHHSPYWKLYTECTISLPEKPKERLTFRSHPNHNNEGPFYDWAMVKFDVDDKFEEDYGLGEEEHTTCYTPETVPAKILGFCSSPAEEEGADDEVYALVHACTFRVKTLRNMDTVLTEAWELQYRKPSVPARMEKDGTHKRKRKNIYERTGNRKRVTERLLEPVLTWVRLDSIVDRVFVMEESPGLKEQVLVQEDDRGEYAAVVLVKKWPLWADDFMGEGDLIKENDDFPVEGDAIKK